MTITEAPIGVYCICPNCNTPSTIEVDFGGLELWLEGSLNITEALPDLDPNSRSLLTNGPCQSCDPALTTGEAF